MNFRATPNPQWLKEYLDASYELIPLNGKLPVGRWRDSPGLSLRSATARMNGGLNIGVRLRATDLVIDVDPRNFAEGDNPLERLRKDFDIPSSPTVRTGDGFHIYLKKPADLKTSSRFPAFPGIDFLSEGRYVVAAGSVHSNGKLYRLTDDDPARLRFEEASDSPAALLSELTQNVATSVRGSSGQKISAEDLEVLLSGLDPRQFNSNDIWLPIMMSAHAATEGTGLEEFRSWSLGDPDYQGHGEIIGTRWNSLTADKVDGITINTLYRELATAGRGDLIDAIGRTPPEDDFAGQVELPKSGAERFLAEMNRDHFATLQNGKFYIGRERIDLKNDKHSVEWLNEAAFRSFYNVQTVPSGDGPPTPLGTFWLKHPKRRQYDGVVFDPSCDPRTSGMYNLWRGWAVEPKPGDWSLLQQLVRKVLCAGDNEAYDYVLRWAAFLVQQPSRPAEVALAFKGAKGIGKGTFLRSLLQIAGQHGKQVAQPEHFVGRFNDHLRQCVFLFVDEGYWAGDKKAEGALKNLITEPTLSYEAKGQPLVSGPNMLHVAIASNERWLVPATPDERRFAVFEADTEAAKKLPPNFFEQIHSETENGGLSAMLYDLLDLDISGWHPRKAIPQTQALLDQKLQGLKTDPIALWWYQRLELGDLGLDFLGTDWASAPIKIGSEDKNQLVDHLNRSAKETNRHHSFSKKALASFLGQVGVNVQARDRKGGRTWIIPSLDQARRDFDRYVGGGCGWENF